MSYLDIGTLTIPEGIGFVALALFFILMRVLRPRKKITRMYGLIPLAVVTIIMASWILFYAYVNGDWVRIIFISYFFISLAISTYFLIKYLKPPKGAQTLESNPPCSSSKDRE